VTPAREQADSESDCSLWELQACTEILRPCSGAVTKATLLKSGLLGERAMCQAFLWLCNLATTYYTDLQENEWTKMSLKNTLYTVFANALLSSQHKPRLAPQEERLISNRLFMCSLRKWEFSMRFSDKLFIWEIFFFFFPRTSSRYFLSEFLPGPFISKCRLFSVKELGLKQGSMGFHLQGSLSGPQLLPFF